MYGSAIRAGKNDLQKMKLGVWAIFFHKLSTDEEPQHEMCTDTCPYKIAQREKKPYTHKNSLPKAVMDTIKPVFRDLSDPDLLRKCLKGYTQNANESVNSLVWRFAPKRKNHGVHVVNTALALAVGVFNDGAGTYAKVMRELGIKVTELARSSFEHIDAARIADPKRKTQAASHEARIRRRQERKARDEAYCAGGF